MTRDARQQLIDNVNATKEQIENEELEPHTHEILDVKITCTLDSNIQKIKLITATGGPHIEIDLAHETVTGYWSGMTPYTQRIENTAYVDYLWDTYETYFKSGDR